MTTTEVNILATYNAEVARGIVHTEAWQIRMMELQDEFDHLASELQTQLDSFHDQAQIQA